MVKRFPKTGLLMLVILGVVILAGGRRRFSIR